MTRKRIQKTKEEAYEAAKLEYISLTAVEQGIAERRERLDHLSYDQRQAVRDIAGVAQGMLDEYKAFSHPTMEQVVSLDDKLTMLRHEFVLSTNL